MAQERVRDGEWISLAFEYPKGLPDSHIIDENLTTLKLLVDRKRPDLEIDPESVEVNRLGDSTRHAHEVVELRAKPRRKR